MYSNKCDESSWDSDYTSHLRHSPSETWSALTWVGVTNEITLKSQGKRGYKVKM